MPGDNLTRPSRIRHWQAALAAVLLPCLCFALVVRSTDRMFLDSGVSRPDKRIAAIAIRDNVSPFEKWGSKQFTWGYLQKYYGRFAYFTQSSIIYPASSPRIDQKAEFLDCLAELLSQCDQVDIFLLAHGNSYVYWVDSLPPQLTSKIRLVYNTGCYDSAQAAHWLSLGAKTYIGHPDVCISPVFYVYFLRRWARGETAGQATSEANSLVGPAIRLGNSLCLQQFGNTDELWRKTIAVCFGDSGVTIQGGPGR